MMVSGEHSSLFYLLTTVEAARLGGVSPGTRLPMTAITDKAHPLVPPSGASAEKLNHSLTHSLIHPFTHSSTHTLTQSPIHSLTHALTHTLTHTLIHSLTHSHTLTHSLTHSLTD